MQIDFLIGQKLVAELLSHMFFWSCNLSWTNALERQETRQVGMSERNAKESDIVIGIY